MSDTRSAASSTQGFFQAIPHVRNQYDEDASLRHAILLFMPQDIQDRIQPDLSSFGARVISPEVLSLVKDAEHNPPRLETWDTFGQRKDELITSHGWQQLQAIGIQEGIVAIPYEQPCKQYSRLYQFAKYHLWCGSNAIVTCPSAMTDGAAALLKRHLKDNKMHDHQLSALRSAYSRLTSRNPTYAWTSGQWMTERPGGSDVGNTESRARRLADDALAKPSEAADGSLLGEWSIDGFKWFSSATDADMSVLLAKTPGKSPGTEELSAFFAPMRREAEHAETFKPNALNTVPNGVHPQRLKSKLGTRPLPTAELELKGMRGHLLGQRGKGVREIATILNITRIHNAVSAMGSWGRGLAVARAFARVRRVQGSLLIDVPAHVRDLAWQHSRYRAYMLFTFFVASLLGAVEHYDEHGRFEPFLGVQSAEQAALLLRLLTPVLKAKTALATIDGLRWTMESMGGVGYLENENPILNVARLFRDSNVLAIWEGTTNVMAHDTARVLRPSKSHDKIAAFEALNLWVRTSGDDTHGVDEGVQRTVQAEVDGLQQLLKAPQDERRVLYHGQNIMDSVDYLVTSTLLQHGASKHPSNEVNCIILERWPTMRNKSGTSQAYSGANEVENFLKADKAIMLEYEPSAPVTPMSKL